MSDIDLTEAIKAASAAIAIRWNEWRSDADRKAALAVEDALPIIEAAVREKVAAEIEAEREAIKRRHGSDPEDVYVRGRLYGFSVAAGIAKNGPRL